MEIQKLKDPFSVRLNTRPKNRNAVTARVVGTAPSDTVGIQEVHLERPARIRDAQGVLMSVRFLHQVMRTGKLYAAGERVYAFLPGGERLTRVIS